MGECDAATIQLTLEDVNDIPVIDLSLLSSADNAGSNPAGVVAEIGKACEKWGVFQVVNHGVPLELQAKFDLVMKQFFAQPVEEKRKLRKDIDVAKQEVCEEYGREMEKLSYRLLELICLSLGVQRQRLNGFFKDHCNMGRIIHCPPCAVSRPALGTHQHTDVGALTVLSQDDVGGLEVLRKADGEWVQVTYVPDAYVVNVGDMLEVWSNQKYESLQHRAMANSDRERFSVPFFFNPALYVVVEPLEELTNEQTPAKYNALNWGKYYSSRKYGNFKNPDMDVLRLRHFKVLE
ncbi:hypothetical protein RJ640_006847 [Escallonia rubra]|uniref:Fe2OG dioxygenase domain-containing protein n=1 Tax=Escallonia rubra TaxID=112253 RepID=A0AA88RJP6_9ASTE|nr:hypothetical protein RJ640_006847 [Escallonia rubra]